MVYKQHKFISHSTGSWEVQDQDAGRFSVCWGPASWFINSCLPATSLCGRRDERALWGLFYEDTNPIHEGLPPCPNHLPKDPLPNANIFGIRFQHRNLGRTQTFSLQHWLLGLYSFFWYSHSFAWYQFLANESICVLGKGNWTQLLSNFLNGRFHNHVIHSIGGSYLHQNITQGSFRGASFCNLTFTGVDLGKRQENRGCICGSSLIFKDLTVKTHYLNSNPSSFAL